MTEEAATAPDDDDVDDAPPHRGIEGKKGGCLIVFFGSMVLGGASIGLSYLILQARNAPVLEATTELADIMKAAEAAPGTKELRDLGCDRAGVFELPALKTLAQRLEDVRAKKEKRGPKAIDLGSERSVVACTMQRQATPTCEDVAKKYVGATKPGGTFTVSIVNLNGEVCAEDYREDGTRMGPAKSPNLPPLTGGEPP